MRGRCELCPRGCLAARFDPVAPPQTGFCGARNGPRLFRWGPHFGEEPPITGERGSGCLFFSGCTMRCVYCQNSPWTWSCTGWDMTVERLAEIMCDLACKDKVENWNLVSPTPYLPFIRDANYILKARGVKLPFVWNSSGFERVDTLEEYRALCDWALFDLRYARNKTAEHYSGTSGYVEAARAAIKWAYENTKLIVRILVLPGLADEAVENLAWLATELSSDVTVSLMSQYTSAHRAKYLWPLNRGITHKEYAEVTEAAADFGFENGWVQGFGSADPSLAFLGENMTPHYGAVGKE